MEKVSNGVYRSVSGYVNGYIIDGDDGVTLVDTGLPKRLENISNALVGIGRRLADVKTIVITHGHGDHYGSAAAVKAESMAPLVASEVDAPILRGEVKAPVPPFVEKYRFLKPLVALVPAAPSVDVDVTIGGDQPISLVADLSAIQTPGHTEGHMSLLLDRDGGILFVGDAAVSDRSGEVKRGFINLPTETFDNSLRKLAAHDFETAYFGHAKPIATGAAGAFRRFVESI
jgi:glyoxylase-like metal-dependent hydrolase (beta-lactamase superfamily II)